MKFSDGQLERYSRQIILKEVGVKGQEKFLKAKVLIIGTGGLGAPAAMYLAAAGVGTVGLVDCDKVELSNLQRQIIHSTGDVGKPKVVSGQETIWDLNPEVEVVTYQEWVSAANIADIVKDRNYDFIIDATDNFPAKFLINDACVLMSRPFSHAGIIRFQGQTMTYVPGQGPCYRCVFVTPPPPDAVPTCRQAGVLGVMGGIIGTIQAAEALKYILGTGELLTGRLLTFDASTMNFRQITLARRATCQVCGDCPTISELIDHEQAVCGQK
ncbi:putative adenylyltransferase/sulfurtransferase MoeZ [Peptococcaceae bacterium CEB3]|nr:putative adenylyltransferase/sulfurtransferase MoeZ [Peptococcaceae bacterium CEB3]